MSDDRSKLQIILEDKVFPANTELNMGLSEELMTVVAKGLGPSIYNLDAAKVSGSDEAEKETVKQNYLMKKLGLADGPELMAAIDECMEVMGSSNPNKWRILVYAWLCNKFSKQDVYGL